MVFLVTAIALAACGARTSRPTGETRSALAPGEHRLEVDGTELTYLVAGTGPVCVAHPGGPGFDAAYLRMAELEAHLTMVYVTPVGTGASGRLADATAYGIERNVADVEAVRAALGVDRILLLGHSYGGFVALSYALEYEERLSGLILYDTTPTTGPEWQASVGEGMKKLAARAWYADAAAAAEAEATAQDEGQLNALVRRQLPLYFADWDARGREYAARMSASRLSRDVYRAAMGKPYDVRDALADIRTPTLILVGAHDVVTSPRWAQEMRGRMPSSQLVTLEASGHFGHIEEPEHFADAVSAWVAKVTPRGQ